ncbi:hypothetical protein SESBI_33230 [Sesbania bispinosa]|nr:hypothetical protein SESBI_33230 [Sesbania bispinosa]
MATLTIVEVMETHVVMDMRKWSLVRKNFSNKHNHGLLSEKYVRMLPAHRKMNGFDIVQMNQMRKVGISTRHIYGSFAKQAGGYERIGFKKQDMYNEIERQRRFKITSRAEGLHAYLGKYVNSRNNLVEFLVQFNIFLEYMQFKEVEADYNSLVGEPILQTPYEELERSASKTLSLIEYFRDMCRLCGRTHEKYERMRDQILSECKLLREESAKENENQDVAQNMDGVNIKDPVCVRTKGCGSGSSKFDMTEDVKARATSDMEG